MDDETTDTAPTPHATRIVTTAGATIDVEGGIEELVELDEAGQPVQAAAAPPEWATALIERVEAIGGTVDGLLARQAAADEAERDRIAMQAAALAADDDVPLPDPIQAAPADTVDCPMCDGTGELDDGTTCPGCNGETMEYVTEEP